MNVYLVEAVQNEDSTDLFLFSRDKDKKKAVTKVSDFLPYFFVLEDETVKSDYRIKKIESGFTSIDGEKLKKVYVSKSVDIKSLRDSFSKSFEADIPFPQRYVIDVIGEQTPVELRELYFDIEVNSGDTFPDIENPDQEVTFISYFDSFEQVTRGLLYQREDAKVKIESNDTVRVFNSEAAMLRAFLDTVEFLDPDIISGWNINGFDLPYIIRRMNQFGLEYFKLSPLNSVFIDSNYEEVTIKGRLIVDMMKFYQLFRQLSNQGKADSYSLEYTSQEVLGSGKLAHPEGFRELWLENPQKLVDYGLRDTKLVYDINKKLEIIPFFDSIRSMAGCFITEVHITSRMIDGFLLLQTRSNPVLPSKNTGSSDKFSGAFVVEPKAGVYDNVLALDIKAMYPNLIKTFNISYETFDTNGDIRLYDDVAFTSNTEGLIPKILKKLDVERGKYKKLRKEAEKAKDWSLYKFYDFRQYAVKVVANSLYGFLGYPGSRLYKKVVANAVTNMGKNLILHTKSYLESLGYEVIYGDTDSVYVLSQQNAVLDILVEGDFLVSSINKEYENFAKKYNAPSCTLQMEFEKVFSKLMFLEKKSGAGAKKRYAYRLLWHADKTDIGGTGYVGLDLVRSDSAKISKDVQKEVIEMVLDDKSEQEIVERLRTIDLNIRSGIISQEDFSFPTGISKHLNDYGASGVPPVIRGAKYSNKYLGTNFSRGSKPKWTYIKRVPRGYPETNVVTFEYTIPDGFEPDYDIIIEKTLKDKLERIFKAAGFGEFPNLDASHKKLSEWGF